MPFMRKIKIKLLRCPKHARAYSAHHPCDECCEEAENSAYGVPIRKNRSKTLSEIKLIRATQRVLAIEAATLKRNLIIKSK